MAAERTQMRSIWVLSTLRAAAAPHLHVVRQLPRSSMAAPGRVEALADGSSWRWEEWTAQSGQKLPVTVTFHLRVDGARLC